MKYLQKRQGRYQYYRRVPTDLVDKVGGTFARQSLDTDDLAIACERVKAANDRTEAYWAELRAMEDEDSASSRYEAAMALVRTLGFRYRPLNEMVESNATLDIVQRLEAVSEQGVQNAPVARAVMGTVEKPPIMLEADGLPKFWTYTRDKLRCKSPEQIRRWSNPRKKAVRNFLGVVGGDISIHDITRDQALDFRDWWSDRLEDLDQTANNANKDFTHLSQIMQVLSDSLRLGIDNPFRGLRFQEEKRARPPLPADWIRDVLLKPGALGGTNLELRCLVLIMVETGARPSELCGLEADDILLDHDVPHIKIRANAVRDLKTAQSVRDQPLVGVALEAAKQIRQGFQDYQGKYTQASAAINKYLRENGLVPGESHSLYSLRHSFDDRLGEVETPERVQAALMGHKYGRPKYGKGPSLEQKKRWIEEIAFDV